MLNNKLHFVVVYPSIRAFLAAQWMVKNLPANERDTSLIPGLERSPGEGNEPTPVFLPGKSQGQRSLAGYSPGGHKESDVTDTT